MAVLAGDRTKSTPAVLGKLHIVPQDRLWTHKHDGKSYEMDVNEVRFAHVMHITLDEIPMAVRSICEHLLRRSVRQSTHPSRRTPLVCRTYEALLPSRPVAHD